jgi:sortase A
VRTLVRELARKRPRVRPRRFSAGFGPGAKKGRRLLPLPLLAVFPWQDNANTYIAAHRLGWPGTGSYRQFYNLPLLAKGDVIYLGDVNGITYTYEVTGFKEITPDETWVTTPQPGRDMVSLQTCIENFGDYWTMGPNWYVRYIVQADRVSVDVTV